MTGCARFFIALIIIAPLAYLGAAYYNGENGIQNIKDLLGIGAQSGEQDQPGDTYQDTSEDLKKTLTGLEQKIDQLEQENAALKKANADLRQQLEAASPDSSGQQ